MNDQYNRVFIDPIDTDSLKDYCDYVKTPMCFRTVKTKLDNNQYHSNTDWYNDVCLIYQNAINYHSQTGDRYFILQVAKFFLWKFQHEMKYFNIRDEREWMQKIVKKTNKIANLMKSIPASSQKNSSISGYLRKSVTEPVPSDKVLDIVNKANKVCEDVDYNEEVSAILKEAEGLEINDSTQMPIAFEKLNPNTQAALVSYVEKKAPK